MVKEIFKKGKDLNETMLMESLMSITDDDERFLADYEIKWELKIKK